MHNLLIARLDINQYGYFQGERWYFPDILSSIKKIYKKRYKKQKNKMK